MSKSHGKFVWYDVMTTNTKAAESFYRSVIGWDTSDSGMTDRSYTLLSMGSIMVGGLMPIPDHAKGVPPAWMGYVAVDDVAAHAEKVKAAGGAIHRGPTEIPNVGTFAIAGDPDGAPFGGLVGLEHRMQRLVGRGEGGGHRDPGIRVDLARERGPEGLDDLVERVESRARVLSRARGEGGDGPGELTRCDGPVIGRRLRIGGLRGECGGRGRDLRSECGEDRPICGRLNFELDGRGFAAFDEGEDGVAEQADVTFADFRSVG